MGFILDPNWSTGKYTASTNWWNLCVFILYPMSCWTSCTTNDECDSSISAAPGVQENGRHIFWFGWISGSSFKIFKQSGFQSYWCNHFSLSFWTWEKFNVGNRLLDLFGFEMDDYKYYENMDIYISKPWSFR